jgi:hypothetical protein
MNMATSPRFTPTSKNAPCPICANSTGHCKTKEGSKGDTLIHCHNHPNSPGQEINGYKWIKGDAGEWGIFAPVDSTPPAKSTASKAPKKSITNGVRDRDAAFRAYMANLTLHPDDRADLVRRGLSDAQILAMGAVSIEGNDPGYICPCYSPSGLIIGAQWRLRNPGEDVPRYKWINWIGGGAKNGDELPLTVHRPIEIEAQGIAIVEGIGAKSFILAQRSGMVTIGAGSDSQFVSSPQHWEIILKALTDEQHINTLTFYPDAGSVVNDSVLGKYKRWFEFAEKLGYAVQIAWWGQTIKGEVPDIDELPEDAEIELITVADFLAMAANPPKETLWPCLPAHNRQIGTWKVEVLGKNTAEIAKAQDLMERAKTDPDIVFVGEHQAQANGDQMAHPLWTFKQFTAKLNFDFVVTKLLDDVDGGYLGLRCKLTNGARRVDREILIKSTDCSDVKTWINAMKKAIGGNVACTLRMDALQALIQNRQAQYRNAGGRHYRLADRTGRQSDGYWVFEKIQFDPTGKVCTEAESGWVFNRNLGTEEHIVSPTIAPQSDTAISELIGAARAYYCRETLPQALLTMGYGFATIHRDEILKDDGSFPQLNVFGDAGGGKTLAALMAGSPFGTHESPVTDFSTSMIYEWVKSIGSMPLIIDDPIKQEKTDGDKTRLVNNFCWAMYGSAPRKVRGNVQTPHTNVIVTSNKALGEDTNAIESRLIKLYFPKGKFNDNAHDQITAALANASGGLSTLIAQPYDRGGIRAIAAQLRQFLPNAHDRIATNFAIVAHYTQRLCDLAGFQFDVLGHVIKVVCPQADEAGSAKDSLTDFLEKLSILRSRGIVGEWNVTQIKRDYEPYLAVHLPDVWDIFTKNFSVNYSRQSIEALITEAGGERRTLQRFVPSAQTWADYQRAKDAHDRDTSDYSRQPTPPKKTAQRHCALIPAKLLDAAIGIDSLSSNYSDMPSEAAPPTTPTPETTETPETTTEVAPIVVAGDVAVLVEDLPADGLKAGDEVAIAALHQAEAGEWFVTASARGGSVISIWLSSLVVKTE